MKLRTKIQLFSSLFMLVLILLVNASIYYLFHQISAESELEQVKSQTDTMAEELADINSETAGDLIKAYLPTNGMARIFPQEGEPLAWHWRPDAYTTFEDRKSTRLNSSHVAISYAVFCLKKKKSTKSRCE